jgi:hypothetical protein
VIRPYASSHPSYLRVVRAGGWYDLIATVGFATPWTYVQLHDMLSSLGHRYGLGELPVLDPVQTLYANLMGSLVVVWALLRIIRPLPVHGLVDGTARALFASWMAYALGAGAIRVLWGFFALEVIFGLMQLVPWWRARAGINDEPAASCPRANEPRVSEPLADETVTNETLAPSAAEPLGAKGQ